MPKIGLIPFSSVINGGALMFLGDAQWGGNTVTFGPNGGTLNAGVTSYGNAAAPMNVITTAGAAHRPF